MSAVGTYYDNYGFIYEPLWGDNIHWGLFPHSGESLAVATDLYTQWTCALLAPKPGHVVIDAGIGPACTARHLIRTHRVSVIGVDTSVYQLSRATRASADFISTGSLRLLRADIESETLPVVQPADGAMSLATFFHLHDRRRALRNLAAALKSGAAFVLDDLVTSAPQVDIDSAFGRLGIIRLESEASSAALVANSEFYLSASHDITPDFALTYRRLLERLEAWRTSGDTRLTLRLYNSLRTSFRMIESMALQRKLVCMVRVLIRR